MSKRVWTIGECADQNMDRPQTILCTCGFLFSLWNTILVLKSIRYDCSKLAIPCQPWNIMDSKLNGVACNNAPQ